MGDEISTFINIWLTAAVTLILTHQIATRIPSGAPRLLFILPTIYLFTNLPLRLSSFHLGCPTFFYLVWLANSNLLLFAFNQGPLSASTSTSAATLSSTLRLISTALLPIIIRQPHQKTRKPKLRFPLKCCLLAVIVGSYRYREFMHPYLILSLYCWHLYLGVELLFAITTAPWRAAFGLELEPQFNEPYLATSLQDFWGRRWNLVATGILRPTVYLPVRRISTRIVGRRWARPVSTLAGFLVSGLMHEVMCYYLTRVSPTWEVTGFFVLHGFLVAAEVGMKKALSGGRGLPAAVSRPLTLIVVGVTAHWLFAPQFIRNRVDLKAINEYSIVARFIRDRFISLLNHSQFI